MYLGIQYDVSPVFSIICQVDHDLSQLVGRFGLLYSVRIFHLRVGFQTSPAISSIGGRYRPSAVSAGRCNSVRFSIGHAAIRRAFFHMVRAWGIILVLVSPLLQAQEGYEQVLDLQQTLVGEVDHDHQVFDLNTVSVRQLEELPLMTRTIADSIVRYREVMGPYVAVTELQSLGILTREQYTVITTSLTVRDKPDHSRSGYTLLRYSQTLQLRHGYRTNTYLGRPQQLVFRTRYTARVIDLGFTYEKDAGEVMSWSSLKNKQNHLVGYLRVRPAGLVEEIGFGNFQATWGQGLLMGNGFAMGKGRETIHSISRNTSIRPYLSLNETSYFTGAYARLHHSKLQWQLMGSYDILHLTQSGSSLYRSGLFRTPSDTARTVTSRWVAGSQLSYESAKLSNPSSGLILQVSNSFSGRTRWGGRSVRILSMAKNKNALFFGEVARMPEEHALQLGMHAAVSHQADVSLSHRSFSQDYFSPFAENAFREKNQVREQGTYAGLRLQIVKNLQLSMYADVFELTKSDPMAKHVDAMLLLKLEKSAYSLTFYTRHRTMAIRSDARTASFTKGIKRYGNILLDAQLTETLSSRTGAWISFFENEVGTMLHQDLRLKMELVLFAIQGSLCTLPIFLTIAFYLYEPGVSQTFNVPVYYGVSIRTVLVAGFRASRFTENWK